MNDKIIQIPVNELLESLKAGYEEYKECLEKGHDEVDLAHVKGYCTTIEQILSAYGDVTSEEMMKIKTPIIGSVSLRRKTNQVNYDTPTIFRRRAKEK